MSYLNHHTGYRQDLLTTRSIIRKGQFALLDPDGLVRNTIPGFSQCDVTILASPLLGASFVDYLVTAAPGGSCKEFGAAGEELFLYVLQGSLRAWNQEQSGILESGGYLFCPAGTTLSFENTGTESARCFLYKRRYAPLPGHTAHTVLGNVEHLPWTNLEGMEDVGMKDLLPSAADLGFDMNFHILSFRPGASHGYIETHIQEHGAYVLSGQGMYCLDEQWLPVQQGDYLFMGAYCPQAAYAVGREVPFAYLYSKDCNRDVTL